MGETRTVSTASGAWVEMTLKESDYAPGVLLECAERRLLNIFDERLAEIEHEQGPEEVDRVLDRIRAIKLPRKRRR